MTLINGLAKRQADTEKGRHGGAGRPAPLLRISPSPVLTAILVVLFFGPLIAPLFQATRLPFVADSGALARDLLSRYICPTPAKSYVLLGFPMAVCARCWGATIGLWVAWLLLLRVQVTGDRPQGSIQKRITLGSWPFVKTYLALAWPMRLIVGALPFLLWVAEIRLWAGAPYWVLLLNGAFAGFWAGLFFYSIWPGLLSPQSSEAA
jgi:hypothetical protein